MQKEEILENGSIYHYTSIQGLKGILESKSLWLTHYKFLNDPNEMRYCSNDNHSITLKLIEVLTNELSYS